MVRMRHLGRLVPRHRGIDKKLIARCPDCDAAPGQRCISLKQGKSGYERRIDTPHRSRW